MKEFLVKKKIDNLIAREYKAEHLIAQFENDFNVIVFGGAVRDALFGYEKNVRDIDFVLYPRKSIRNKEQKDLLKEIIQIECKSRVRKNQFGGYKIENGNKTMDIWLLSDTWAFKQKLLEATPENLLKSVYLNIDAYALNYCTGEFIAKCNEKKNQEIDIVLEHSACEKLNLLRAVVFQKKYSICLSERIINKLKNMLQQWSTIESEVFEIEKRHYGAILVTMQDIKDAIEGV